MTPASTKNGNNMVVLERSLGKLLGFEEGEAEDLLEHLFTIESAEDLSEYLAQLLGDQTPEVVAFVENVSRHRNGESLAIANDDQDSKLPAAARVARDETNESHYSSSTSSSAAALDSFRAMALGTQTQRVPKKNSNTTNTNTNTNRGASSNRNQTKKSRVPPPKKSIRNKGTTNASATASGSASAGSHPSETTSSTTTTTTTTNTTTTTTATITTPQQKGQQQQSEETTKAAPADKKFHPTRGRAEVVCGCFGTRHKPLTNCLYCGRIACEVEGYGFCPFCGLMIEEEGSNIGSNDRAYQQKERLLRFDRDFARRTEVFDDQADYQGPGTWMTEDEKKEAEENQQRHLESLKRRSKQTLTIAM